jgi:hypothetical protein
MDPQTKALLDALNALKQSVEEQTKQAQQKADQDKQAREDSKKQRAEEKARAKKESEDQDKSRKAIGLLKNALDQAADIQVKLNRINLSVRDTMALSLNPTANGLGQIAAALTTDVASLSTSLNAAVGGMANALTESVGALSTSLTESAASIDESTLNIRGTRKVVEESFTLKDDQMSAKTERLNNTLNMFNRQVRASAMELARLPMDDPNRDALVEEQRRLVRERREARAAFRASAIEDAKAAGTYKRTEKTVPINAAAKPQSSSPAAAAQQNVQALNTLTDATNNAAQIQIQSQRNSLSVADTLGRTVQGYMPAATALNSRMALVENGLESNSEGLGRFLGRADLLGENIQQLAGGMRTLKLTLSLTNSEQADLATSIQDAAKTYTTSTGSLVKALESFGDSLAILNRTQSGGTNDLITNMVAMTDRFAPGALQSILTPLVSQGGESLARMGVLGVSSEMDKILGGGGSVDDMISVLKSLVGTRENLVGKGGQAVIGSEVFQTVTGFSLAQANQAESLIEILEEQKKSAQQTAKLEDALKTINGVLTTLKDPLILMATYLAQAVEFFFSILGNTFVKMSLLLVGIYKGLLVAKSILTGISIMQKAMLVFDKIKTFFTVLTGTVIGGIALLLTAVLGTLMFLSDSSEETSENTKVSAEEIKKKQNQDFMNNIEEYNRKFGASLSTLARMSTRTDLESQMTGVGSEASREKTNALLEQLVTGMQEQTDKIERNRTSAFANGGNRGDGS